MWVFRGDLSRIEQSSILTPWSGSFSRQKSGFPGPQGLNPVQAPPGIRAEIGVDETAHSEVD
jgi:hypothetical protein